MAPRQVRFDGFELRPQDGSLFRHGRQVKLQPQPLRALAYLISRSPAIVTREELGDHIWESGVHVDVDQSLNYCIRQIRQVLDDSATLPRYVETLPRQGYRFICRSEVVPEPEVEPAREERSLSSPDELRLLTTSQAPARMPESTGLEPTPSTGLAGLLSGRRRRWSMALALVAGTMLASAVLAGWIRHTQGRPGFLGRAGSLAVLPIENLSGDPGQEYLADGMTDELTTMLARDSTLRIVSRTSVMQYKGARRPLPEMARALGVDAVIEGSLARSGTRLHMTLQLIRADTDSHLWAESYDRDANDATLPDDAARAIARRLNSATQVTDAVRFVSPAAHDAYLRGRYLWPTNRMEESGAYFRRATEIQPDYAEAWAGLANFYGEGIAAGLMDPRTSMRLEEEAAARSLALAPHLALAHQAVGGAYLIDRWDWANADREILLAISLDPNDAETYYLRSCLLEALRRFPEAIQVEKHSMEMDPYERRDALASMYIYARLYDEAMAEIKLRMEAAPNDPDLLYTAADVWRRKGNYKEAMESWARWFTVTGDPQRAADVRRAYERGGWQGFVRWQLKQRLLEAKTHYLSPVQLASYYAQLGDKEHTLPLLEEGLRQRSTDMLWIQDEPAYDFLHEDGRYRALVRKVGLPNAS